MPSPRSSSSRERSRSRRGTSSSSAEGLPPARGLLRLGARGGGLRRACGSFREPADAPGSRVLVEDALRGGLVERPHGGGDGRRQPRCIALANGFASLLHGGFEAGAHLNVSRPALLGLPVALHSGAGIRQRDLQICVFGSGVLYLSRAGESRLPDRRAARASGAGKRVVHRRGQVGRDGGSVVGPQVEALRTTGSTSRLRSGIRPKPSTTGPRFWLSPTRARRGSLELSTDSPQTTPEGRMPPKRRAADSGVNARRPRAPRAWPRPRARPSAPASPSRAARRPAPALARRAGSAR